GASGALHAPLEIDVEAFLLGVGRARENNIGAMRANIAMRTLIDDEGAAEFVHIELVRAEQPDELHAAAENAGHVLAFDEAEIERANARCRGMQHIETNPAAFCRCARRTDSAAVARDFRGEMEDSGTVRTRERAGADDDHRALR